MYSGSGNVPTETYMIPGTGVSPQMALLPTPDGLDYIANEMAPEMVYDQSLCYPAANYYGYYCTGLESQSEWDDRHRFFGLDGQELHYSGLQTESFPYAYYPPSYGYAPSSYSPYVPGAVIGVDVPIMGTQQYFSNHSYLSPSSPAGYFPVIVQPGADVVSNNPISSSVYSTGAPISSRQTNAGVKYSNHRTSANRGVSSQGNTSGIPASEFSQIASSLRSVNALPNKQSSSVGTMTSGNVTQMTQDKISSGPVQVQVANHLVHGGVSSVQNSSTINAPSNNLRQNYGYNIHGWAMDERSRPRLQYNGVANNVNETKNVLGEQNRGPRTSRPRGQWTSVSNGANVINPGASHAQGAIVIKAEKYNKDDFPVDYPDAKFFVIKSYSEDDVHKSIKYNVWSSTPNGNRRLNIAYEDAQRISVVKSRNCPIFLFFSVNASGQFCGVAEMIGPVDFHRHMNFWQQDKWTGSFPVKWHMVKDVPNTSFRHIILENNENKPVTNSRDTQEITYVPGMNMLKGFKASPLRTSILDDFMFYEERQKIMQDEKSRFIGRNSTYLPAVVSIKNDDDTQKQEQQTAATQKQEQQTAATEHSAKDDTNQNIDQHLIAEAIQTKHPKNSASDSPCNEQSTPKVDAIKPYDDKKDDKPEKDDKSRLERDVNFTISDEKMNSLSIPSEKGEVGCCESTTGESSSLQDVVIVGSMHLKVNGASENSLSTITVGSIPIESKDSVLDTN